MDMKKEMERAVVFLASRIAENVTAEEAVRFAQAALNLANARRVFDDLKDRPD